MSKNVNHLSKDKYDIKLKIVSYPLKITDGRSYILDHNVYMLIIETSLQKLSLLYSCQNHVEMIKTNQYLYDEIYSCEY